MAEQKTRVHLTCRKKNKRKETLVIGGGIAGLTAAMSAARSGAEVLLVEQNAHWGGRAVVDGRAGDNRC